MIHNETSGRAALIRPHEKKVEPKKASTFDVALWVLDKFLTIGMVTIFILWLINNIN